MNQKFKYQTELSQYPNCPPKEYEEVEMEAIRWVKKGDLSNSFHPLNYNKYPLRGFDESDLMCKSFGLSMYNSIEKARKMYEKTYNATKSRMEESFLHEDFIDEKGDAMAIVVLAKETGCMGDLKGKTGHFTFHEYTEADLTGCIKSIVDIFNGNGEFKQ